MNWGDWIVCFYEKLIPLNLVVMPVALIVFSETGIKSILANGLRRAIPVHSGK